MRKEPQEKCENCDVIWDDHSGVMDTCRKLQEAINALLVIKKWSGPPFVKGENKELCDINKLCSLTLDQIK